MDYRLRFLLGKVEAGPVSKSGQGSSKRIRTRTVKDSRLTVGGLEHVRVLRREELTGGRRLASQPSDPPSPRSDYWWIAV